MIPYGKQEILQQDIDAVVDVLTSDFLTQGPKVPEFETLIGKYVDAEYAFAMNSATSALHVACMALELGSGDLLWTTPISFVASANCGLYCGAEVDFVDIDSESFNICPVALEQKLVRAAQEGRVPKVLVAVHLTGQSCDMEVISKICSTYGVRIIEDASHAIGASYDGSKVGANRYSDITIFSFHPVKIITTAEGGLATTNDPKLAQRMDLYRSHGVTRDASLMKGSSEGPWYYQQVALGFNYRMTELQAALGISQLGRLDDFVSKRNELAQRYDQLLSGLPLLTPKQDSKCISARHLYIVRLELDKLQSSRKDIFCALRDAGIGVNVHYIPIHLQPYYRSMGFQAGDYPKAEAFYQQAISLPLHPNLSETDQDYIVSTIKNLLLGA